MKIEWAGITWVAAQNIWLIPVIIIFVILVIWRVWRVTKVRELLTSTRWRSQLLPHLSTWRSIIKAVLLIIGLGALFLALLRPAIPKKEKNIAQEGRDLFIALDISRSMLATDCEPHRLNFAKAKIRRFLSLLGCERVGLILFSGSALVQCPLTTDYPAFFMFLDQVDVETISSGTTAMDQAIRKALDSFASMPEKKTKLLVLLTDGEDFSSNLAGIKQKAAQTGLHIFTLGVGTTQGTPIPLYDQAGKQKGHQLDKRGKVVISRLNEGILQTLANDSGGSYLRTTKDDTDLCHLVSKITAFEKDKFDDKKVDMFEECYPYFLLVAFICLALGWIL